MSSTLRQFQTDVRRIGRSIRKYIPLLATKTGYSPGVITCYMDGYGSDVAKYSIIMAELQKIINDRAEKQEALEISLKRESLEGVPKKRKYNTRHY